MDVIGEESSLIKSGSLVISTTLSITTGLHHCHSLQDKTISHTTYVEFMKTKSDPYKISYGNVAPKSLKEDAEGDEARIGEPRLMTKN